MQNFIFLVDLNPLVISPLAFLTIYVAGEYLEHRFSPAPANLPHSCPTCSKT